MSATAIDSLRGILNGFRDLNSKGIYTMNATETDLLRQILLEVQALSIGGGLADGSVTTPKIADLNVTTVKLADLAVTTAKLDNSSVTSAKIVDGTIAAADLSGAQSGSAPIFGVRAWVNFNGTGTVAIRGSGNVSSITDNGTGDYTVNFTTAFPNANYTVLFFSEGLCLANDVLTARTSSACRIGSFASNFTALDVAYASVIFVG
jgi:hypothetical protein